mgnify:CR=1 FL=1
MGFVLTEKGMTTVNKDTCTGCGACVEACPDKVLTLVDGKARAGSGIFMGCIACGHCVAVCPTESITVGGRDRKSVV